MAQLTINYSQNGSPYMVEFQQLGAVIKTIFVPVSPDVSIFFSDTIPDGLYDVVVYNLGKTPCIVVTWFAWFNPGNNFNLEDLKKKRGIFNGRKLKHTALTISDNCSLKFSGNGYGGKNPVSWVVKTWLGGKGYFKQGSGGVIAKRPTLKIANDVPVSLDA